MPGPSAKRIVESAPAVIPFVRRLCLDDQQSDRWDETLPLLVGFERLRSLMATDLPVHRLGAEPVSTLFHSFSAAVNVRLDDVRFATTDKLVRLICAFPRLQRLAFHCSRIVSDELPTQTTFSPSPYLNVLEFNCVCMDQVLDWFLSLPDRPALRTVGLHPNKTNDFDTIARLLRAVESFCSFPLMLQILVCLSIFRSLAHATFSTQDRNGIRPRPKCMLTLPPNRIQ